MNNINEEILANIFTKKFNVNKLSLTISEICYDRKDKKGSVFFDDSDYDVAVCIDFYLHNNNLFISNVITRNENYNTIQYLERMFYLNIDILKIIAIINSIIITNNNLNQNKKYFIIHTDRNDNIIIDSYIVFNVNKYINKIITLDINKIHNK